MGLAVDIIKRDSQTYSESFIRSKLYSSIVATCLSVRTPIGQAEAIAHEFGVTPENVGCIVRREMASRTPRSNHPRSAHRDGKAFEHLSP